MPQPENLLVQENVRERRESSPQGWAPPPFAPRAFAPPPIAPSPNQMCVNNKLMVCIIYIMVCKYNYLLYIIITL